MMSESEVTELLFRIGARCNIEQYRMLKRCSEKQDITKWNKWRHENPHEEIWLQGVDLSLAHLKGARLGGSHLEGARLDAADLQYTILSGARMEGTTLWGARLQNARLFDTHLERANLIRAHLEGARVLGSHLRGADLSWAHLQGVELRNSHLEGADLINTDLENADLASSHLQGAHIVGSHLENADLMNAHLQGAHIDAHLENANLTNAHLQGAILGDVHLEGADLRSAYLQGANFISTTVNGNTRIWGCKIDKKTNFYVGLESASVEPGLKQSLEYNIRRRRWREWYNDGPWWKKILKKVFIQFFWCLSNYGRSTGWIAFWFFAFAFAFAGIYFTVSGLVDKLHVTGHWSGDLVRAVYFSIVTMTTLGFGDMYAHPQSIAGHLLLILQVLLGYVLLGALITRFAVLFTAGGPAAKFAGKTTLRRFVQTIRVNWKLIRRRKG